MTARLQTCTRHSIEIIGDISTTGAITGEQTLPHKVDLGLVAGCPRGRRSGSPCRGKGFNRL